jgi:predicted transcriptional regulator
MDTLTFIAKVLEHGAWPAAAFGIIYLLRTQLQELLPSIKKFKAGPVEVELERVVKELEKTKQVAAAADAKATVVAAKFDEEDDKSDSAPSEAVSLKSAAERAVPLTEIELKVLKSMVSSRFVTRSVSGVAKDANLSKAAVQTTYGSLIAKGLVEQTKNSEGNPRWVVTALGRTIASEA